MLKTIQPRRIVRGALLFAVPAAMLAAAPPAPTGVPLRIVTLNIKDGIGAQGSVRSLAFGKFITILDEDGPGPNHGLAPDIVHFQEVNFGQQGLNDMVSFGNQFLPGYQVFLANGDGFNMNVSLIRPDIVVTANSSVATSGPRDIVKIHLLVPQAAKPLIVYNAHFKAGGTSFSQQIRALESQTAGNNVSFDLNFGGPNNDGNVNVVFSGDLNSNNNSDGSITNLFFTVPDPQNPVSSGILNLPVETLNGRASPLTLLTTFPGFSSRLDYICLDNELASVFGTLPPLLGQFTQDELNCMGFVYFSSEDGGLRANGDASATNIFTDHRPVVFDIYLPRDPAFPFTPPEDVDASGSVNTEDLYLWETSFALTAPPLPSPAPDLDGNRNVDPNDRALLLTLLRSSESADTTTQ